MNRSLLIGIISTVTLFSVIAIFFYVNNIRAKSKAATEAIPNDAFLIIHSLDILTAWSALERSGLWSDLGTNAGVEQLNRQVGRIVSFVNEHDDVKELLEGDVAVSLHNNSGKLSILCVTETGREIEGADVAGFISSRINGKAVRRSVEKIPVYDVRDAANNPVLTIGYFEGLLLCSPDGSLMEEGLRKLKYKLPNLTNGFEQVQMLADHSAHANLYVNYGYLSRFVSLFTKPENAGMFSYLKGFANWSMLNTRFDKDQVKFTGVTYTDDSAFQFLDLFKNQTPKSLTLQELMPANTTFALQMGFTDYMKFNQELDEYLRVHKKAEAYGRFTDSIENRYDIDIAQRVLPFIDGEASLVMTQPENGNYSDHLAAFIRFKDPVSMQTSLKHFVQAMDKKGEADSISYFYEGIEIERIKLDNFLKLYYGEIMEHIRSPYYAQINDVFVFTNTAETLKHIIAQYKKGATLANDETYKDYAATLAQTNNISIFISPAGNFSLPPAYVTDEFFSLLNTYQPAFRKFTYFNIQFANTNNKAFYTHVQYRYNTTTAAVGGETQQLWSAALDTVFDMPPQVVYNSKLKQQVIFVQDVKNTLYCLGMDGRLIWRSKLSAKLVGKFHVVDVRKDGSYCYLFGTEKQVNLIDEEGVSLENYPVSYPGRSILPFTLVQEPADSEAVYFVPLANQRIIAYRLNGKPLTGWNPKILDGQPAQPVATFRAGAKRYIYTTDEEGRLWVFNARGQRIRVTGVQPAACYQYLYSADTSRVTFMGIDTGGNVFRIAFDSVFRVTDTTAVAQINPFRNITSVQDAVTQKTCYLTWNETSWTVYNDAFKQVVAETTTETPLVYFTTDASDRIMIAKVSRATREYYLYNVNGELYPEFPVKGFSAFTTGNLMQDKSTYLLGGDDLNNIFLHRLR